LIANSIDFIFPLRLDSWQVGEPKPEIAGGIFDGILCGAAN